MIFDLVNSRACHVGVDVVVVVLVVCKEVRSRCALRDLMWVHVAVVWFARRMFFKCACVCVCVCVCACVCVCEWGALCFSGGASAVSFQCLVREVGCVLRELCTLLWS